MPFITVCRFSAPLLLLSAAHTASAQTITTAAAGGAIAQVPTNGPLALGVLLAALLLAAWRQLRRGPAAQRVLAWLAVVVLGVAMHDAGLLAVSPTIFTNPAGETRPIPVVPTTAGADFTGFDEATFTNSAGVSLRVSALTPPDMGQCFTGAHPANTLLQPGAPSTSTTPLCSVGTVLINGGACRVDVDAICRGLLGASPTLTSVSPSTGPSAGGTAVTLTGSRLTGTTGVDFGGMPVTSVTVNSDTSLTVTTPAHIGGAVDVSVNTPAGKVKLPGGFTYPYAIGQALQGGVIGTLAAGVPKLIAASADSGLAAWGGNGTAIGAPAQSDSDGAANTSAIVSALGGGGYAAALCDSLNTSGYADWYLPANNQLAALSANLAAIGGFATDHYWSSTEFTHSPTSVALAQYVDAAGSSLLGVSKSINLRVRCVRNYTP